MTENTQQTRDEVYQDAVQTAIKRGYSVNIRFGKNDGFHSTKVIQVARRHDTVDVTVGLTVHLDKYNAVTFEFNHMTTKAIKIENSTLGSFDNSIHFNRHEENFEDVLHALYSREQLETQVFY